MGNSTSKINLVIVHSDIEIVSKYQLGNKDAVLQGTGGIQIGYVPCNKVIVINCQGVTFVQQTFKVRIMIGQCA